MRQPCIPGHSGASTTTVVKEHVITGIDADLTVRVVDTFGDKKNFNTNATIASDVLVGRVGVGQTNDGQTAGWASPTPPEHALHSSSQAVLVLQANTLLALDEAKREGSDGSDENSEKAHKYISAFLKDIEQIRVS